MIPTLSSREALGSIVRSLRLPAPFTGSVGDELIAQSLRRAVYIEAPCPPYALARATREALAGLGTPDEALETRIEDVMESLIAYGDILEMRAAGEDRWEGGDALELRAAPPAFVLRKNKSVVLLGVAGDEITPLPGDWDARVQYRGALRIVTFETGEDARALLREMGLFELPEAVWLRLPSRETPAAHIKAWRDRLAAEPPSTLIEGLEILDTRKPPTYYRGRWTQARSSNDGFFIARRREVGRRHKVRVALIEDIEQLGGIVEVDETFVGGLAKNKHKDKRGGGSGTGGIGSGKTPIVGAVKRKGNVIARVVNNVRAATLEAFIHEAVSHKVSLLCTDQWVGYKHLGKEYPHAVIDHAKEQYVVGSIHTQTIEGFWSIIKRGIVGSFHKVSKKYLPLYVAEFQFRYNNRENADIFGTAIGGC